MFKQMKTQIETDVEALSLSEEEALFQSILQQTQDVKSLTSDISSLLSAQQADLNSLEANTNITTETILHGVSQLAHAKKREANKHTTRGTIATGITAGVTGLAIAGPVGFVIGTLTGATVGGALGKTLTSLSRHSIDNELDKLLKLRSVELQSNGDLMCTVEAFELERHNLRNWVPFKMEVYGKRKLKKTWVDAKNADLPVEAPCPELFYVQSKYSADAFLPYIINDKDTYRKCKEDINSMRWSWGRGGWHIDLKRDGCDVHGWEYARSSNSESWYAESFSTAFVRRRRWIHFIIGSKRRSNNVGNQEHEITTSETNSGRSSVDQYGGNEALQRSIVNMTAAEELGGDNSLTVLVQGEQIQKSFEQAALVSKTTTHAERIARAADVSGIFKNYLSSSPSTVKRIRLEQNRQAETSETDENRSEHQYDSVSRLERSTTGYLRTVKEMQSHVTRHNSKLDEVEIAVDNSRFSLKHLRKHLDNA